MPGASPPLVKIAIRLHPAIRASYAGALLDGDCQRSLLALHEHGRLQLEPDVERRLVGVDHCVRGAEVDRGDADGELRAHLQAVVETGVDALAPDRKSVV